MAYKINGSSYGNCCRLNTSSSNVCSADSCFAVTYLSTSMSLVFTWPELISMVAAVLLMTILSNDGDSNWFDGAVLLSAYLIMGIGFICVRFTLCPEFTTQPAAYYLIRE